MKAFPNMYSLLANKYYIYVHINILFLQYIYIEFYSKSFLNIYYNGERI